MSKDCVFCKIIRGELPVYKIYEDDFFIAILDINPAAYGHTLVIPKEHFTDLTSLGEDYARGFLPFTKKVAVAVKDIANAEGFNLVQNNGRAAGQEIFHFHAHIVPRVIGDGLRFNWISKSSSKEFMTEMTAKLSRKLNE
jgi:histidine triad (HIT) family protein